MIPVLIETALRALLVALIVWTGLRLCHVKNVLAQKAAWGLVLVCAVAMPLLMRWQVLPPSMAFTVPLGRKPVPAQDAPPSHAERMAESEAALLPEKTEQNIGSHPAASTVSGYKVNSEDHARHPGKRSEEAGPVAASYVDAPHAQTQTPAESFSGRIRGRAAVVERNAGTLGWLLYLAVCGVLLIRVAYGLNLAMELWQAAEVFVPYPQDDPGFGLRMRFSRAVSSPVTIGSGVLLPYECLEWDAEKLRIVLAHERSHVRQVDFYLQIVAGLYAAVFWFSPLGWWLKRKLTDLGEAISDRAGLEEAQSRVSYAQVLLEFAVLPRPTAIGVAMARSSNLSHRIDRLLNESSFRQAFAGSRRRVLIAVMLVPLALFAGTALIRVEAAQSEQAVQPPPPAAAPSTPLPSDGQAPPTPAAPATSPSSDDVAPVPPSAPAAAPIAPVLPAPPQYGEIHDSADDRAITDTNAQDNTNTNTNTNTTTDNGKHSTSVGRGYSYSYSDRDGDTMAIVSGNGNVSGSGEFGKHFSEVRKQVHGDFLYYEHEGHAYVIDDRALVAKAKALYAPIDELGRQQEALGKQQEELGRRQEELGRKQEQTGVPTPDISKEMAELNAAVAKLEAKKGSTVTEDDLSNLEGKIGDIQGRLGELQGKMGEQMGRLGDMQGKLGEEQGKLGEQQGQLGEQQGKLAEEADRKLKLMFEESLHDGKARPVE